jgi:hypothetical protein
MSTWVIRLSHADLAAAQRTRDEERVLAFGRMVEAAVAAG